MESQTVERVTEWDSEPFSDGHAGLRELAEREFTGAVTEGGAWLFMLNGRVLGVFDGDMDRFADADGTAYVAPDRSLPLLFAMKETGGEVRGEYYTEETPISEVDGTLKSGSFTGYVELSDNVLSGDYYLVYYGGRRLPVAFIGNQERRITGEEAFERADDEVGIYQVTTVDLDIVDVPEEPSAESTAAAAGSADTEEPSAASTESTSADDSPASSEPSTAAESATASNPATESATAGDSASTTDPDPETTDRSERSDSPADAATSESTASSGRSSASTNGTPEQETDDESTGPQSVRTDAGRSATEAAEAAVEENETTEEPASASQSGQRFSAESEWRESTTIPALDPDQSVSMDAAEESTAERNGRSDSEPRTEPEPATERASSEELEALREERDRLRERVEELEAENERLESETERLAGDRDRLEEERDEAAARAEELEDELESLRATVDELEAELETAREYVPEGDHEIPPEEALAGTSLFVRYERKGGPTLDDAHNGDAGREAVNDNLRLEHHTEFDADGAVVDGEPFEEWLRSTVEYGFVEWLTRSFVHDVRETRNQTSMGTLYDAIPDIDRVELQGTVGLDEEAEEAEEENVGFDVVLRDRMGQPLIVTDLNDSREPATEPMLESLVRNATPVAETNERLAAAFFVTSSYYEPGALETAEEATGGGFLGRGKHKSFVKLSRKEGYHLCLVETRDGDFHVSVPEL